MLEKILAMYTLFMNDSNPPTSPLPHLVGPPGCGKSSSVHDAAKLLGCNLHILNVSRLNPLDVEGLNMPVDNNTRVELLLAPVWDKLQDGDILLLEEFLRGFPEVYNALLDILTSRQVAGHELPKVFIIGASNSTVAYDEALTDRLLHLPVEDIRKSAKAARKVAAFIVDALGMHPAMLKSTRLTDFVGLVIAPTYNLLDTFNGSPMPVSNTKAASARHIIGAVKLRQFDHIPHLQDVIDANNSYAIDERCFEYFIYYKGTILPDNYETYINERLSEDALTEVQRVNATANLSLYQADQLLASSIKPKE